MRLIWGTQDDILGRWIADFVAQRIPDLGRECAFGAYASFGVIGRDEQLLGGVVFHNYHPGVGNIEASFASDSPRWLTKSLIARIMAYPFDQLHCRRVTAATPRRAASARRFLETFGFKREGLVREGFGDDDMIVSGLLRREWLQSRWVQPSRKGDVDGEVRPEAAASA